MNRPRPCRARRIAAHLAPLIALSLSAAALPACSGTGQATQANTTTRAPRIDALLTGPLVLPVKTADINSGRAYTVALDDGRRLSARLFKVSVRVSGFGPGGAPADPWLPAVGEWSSQPFDETREGGGDATPGSWFAVIDLPGDTSGQSLLLNGIRTRVNWLPPMNLLSRLDRSSGGDPWQPTLPPAAAENLDLLARIRLEAQSPLTRWRYHLLTNGLRIARPDDGPQPEVLPPFADPVIEAIALQNEHRVRVGLAALWNADAELAARVKQRLSAVLDLADGTFAPVWPTDHTGMDRLVEDLLNPDLSPIRRAELAEDWLLDQPQAVAWVIDDGGTIDETRDTIVGAIGVANLMDRATLAWVEAVGNEGTPDLRPLPSMTAIKLMQPGLAPKGHTTTAPLSIHAGRWSSQLTALQVRTPATPPGLNISPFACDYSMEGWTAGAASTPKPDWATAALLHRPPLSPGTPQTAAASRRWELFIECRLVPGVGFLDQEVVRIFIGPAGKPTSILRVSFSGLVTNEVPRTPLADEELGAQTSRVEVVRAADRWSFRIPLPPGAVQSDGLVQLALTRNDALGRRTAWPRPMLPWQTDPARAAIDTKQWTDFDTSRD